MRSFKLMVNGLAAQILGSGALVVLKFWEERSLVSVSRYLTPTRRLSLSGMANAKLLSEVGRLVVQLENKCSVMGL